MARSKRTAVAAAAGVLALGAGIGIASYAAADPSGKPTPSASSSNGPGNGGPGGHHRGSGGPGADHAVLATSLATKLGLEEAKVNAALEAYRAANRPTAGERPDREARDVALAAALAESLGVDEAKVTAALAEIRAEQAASRTAVLKTRLDVAVKAGTLTQAEADAVLKAAEKGVIRIGPGR